MTRNSPSPPSDIVSDSWVNRCFPQVSQPYLHLSRLDRPIGVWLLLLPCWWSVALASPSWPDPLLLFLFAIGALLMRAAGCTVNDIADRDFDRQVARTALRPLAAGAVSRRQATVFLISLLLLAFLVLLQFNVPTILLGMASLPLVALYPFAKRFTYWPQLMLGITFNWGALVGWMAVHGELNASAYLLYIAGIAWTLGYDTIYAHQDKEDDALIGVKSTALLFGNRTKTWLGFFYSIAFLCFGAAFFLSGLNIFAWLGLIIVAGHFTWQIFVLDINDPRKCLLLFKRNRDAGIVVFVSIVLGSIGG